MGRNIVTIFFFLFISSFGLLLIITEDQSFSEHENRPLASFPKVSIDRLFSGKFMEDFESYVTDQFPVKPLWVGMKAKAEQSLGKKENNGILFGDHGYLLEPYERTDEQMYKNISYINEFAKQLPDVNVHMLLAPTAVDIYADFLPRYASSDSQKTVLSDIEASLDDSIDFINVHDSLLKKKEEPIYFRTDHHWTMRGAYYAYIQAGKQMKYTPLFIDEFTVQAVSNSFYGTHYSKANDLFIQPDVIEYFKTKNETPVKVIYNEADIADEMVHWEALEQRDKYQFFLRGNNRLVEIQTGQKNGRKIAVIKDSYAHIFIPFLANHYEEIHVIDLRYFRDSTREYIKQHDITGVLFLYNVASFSKDHHLIWLKM